jgi:hypothetical protein
MGHRWVAELIEEANADAVLARPGLTLRMR